MIQTMVAIGLGGLLGTLLRYGIGLWLVGLYPRYFFLATLTVNWLGCLAIGFLHSWFSGHADWPLVVRSTLMVGVLGGFTTFSSFSLDTLRLLETGQLGLALGYLGLSVGGGVLAAWLGLIFGR